MCLRLREPATVMLRSKIGQRRTGYTQFSWQNRATSMTWSESLMEKWAFLLTTHKSTSKTKWSSKTCTWPISLTVRSVKTQSLPLFVQKLPGFQLTKLLEKDWTKSNWLMYASWMFRTSSSLGLSGLTQPLLAVLTSTKRAIGCNGRCTGTGRKKLLNWVGQSLNVEMRFLKRKDRKTWPSTTRVSNRSHTLSRFKNL